MFNNILTYLFYLKFWQHGAQCLFFQSEDDQGMHPDYIKAVKGIIPEQYLKNMDFVFYPGAGHLLEPPHSPLCRANWNNILSESKANIVLSQLSFYSVIQGE